MNKKLLLLGSFGLLITTTFRAGAEWEVVGTIPVGNSPWGVDFTPDGGTALVNNVNEDSVSVIDVATHSVTATILVGNGPSWSAVAPDGSFAYIPNSYDDTVSVIDLISLNVTDTIPVGNEPKRIAFAPTGTTAYVTQKADDSVSVIDTTSHSVTAKIPVGDRPDGVAVSPAGTVAYVANQGDDTISVVEVATHSVIDTFAAGNNPKRLAFKPDGTIAYIPHSDDDSVNVIEVATHSAIALISVGDQPSCVAFAPNNTTAGVTNPGDDTVSMIGATTHTVTQTLEVGDWPTTMAFSPDGTIAYVVNMVDDTVSILEEGAPQPDLWIKQGPTWLGDDIYNTDATDQTTAGTVGSGQTRVFRARLYSDSSEVGTFWIQGPGGDADWNVQYYWGTTVNPAREVTAKVTSVNGWRRGNVPPDGRRNFLIVVTPAPGVIGSFPVQVTATSDSDPEQIDCIQAITTVPDVQPDLHIKKGPVWGGDDIYNDDGTDQKGVRKVLAGTSAVFRAYVQNDGDEAETFKIFGPAGDADWEVQYYWGKRVDAGREVTANVTSPSGWKRPNVPPGSGRYFLIVVTPRSGLPVDSKYVALIQAKRAFEKSYSAL